MRFCVALAFQNEAHWLRLHLPRILEAESIDGIVALDGGSQDDGPEILVSLGAIVWWRPFDWDFGAHKNGLIEACEDGGYDAMLLLDPDELMFPEDVDRIADTLEMATAVKFPTYHFEGDRYHWMPHFHPDPHIRAWRLDQSPIRYQGLVHEWPHQHGEIVEAVALDCHLYHYSGIQPRTEQYRLKHINYARIKSKLEPFRELPAGMDGSIPYRPRERFEGPQPLDPDVIGARAPFEEFEEAA